jgi:hypothetical protein
MWFIFSGKARKNEPLTRLIMRAKQATVENLAFMSKPYHLMVIVTRPIVMVIVPPIIRASTFLLALTS